MISMCWGQFASQAAQSIHSEAGLAPDFSVIDTAEGRLVYQKALDYVMEKFYEGADKKKKALLYPMQLPK